MDFAYWWSLSNGGSAIKEASLQYHIVCVLLELSQFLILSLSWSLIQTQIFLPPLIILYILQFPLRCNSFKGVAAAAATALKFLADQGEARSCSTNSSVIHSLIDQFSNPFPSTALQCRHTQKVIGRSSSYKINYVIVIKTFLNLKGHQNLISGSEVTAILLKGWIWPFGGVASGWVCACSLRSRLVF